MDVEEILKNVQHYYETLLPKAYCFAGWDEENITKAFQWARFCEQIYYTFVGKASAEKLDKLIQSASKNFENNRKDSVCFDDLKKCTAALIQAFFENPTVQNDFIEAVLLKTEPLKNDANEHLHDAADLDSLCIDLIESLKPISIANSNRSLYYEVKAELFLDYLRQATHQRTTEEQVENQLTSAFDALCEDSDKMMILLHVLIHKPKEVSKEIEEIQEFAINWLVLKILQDKNCSLAHFLWKQTPQKLRIIAARNMTFYSFYSEFITKCAAALKFEPEKGSKCWSTSSSNPSEVILPYDEVLNHFQNLLSIDDSVSESTRQHLLSLVNSQTESLIWREIYSFVAMHTSKYTN